MGGGDLTEDLTGNLTENLTGNLTENLTGKLSESRGRWDVVWSTVVVRRGGGVGGGVGSGCRDCVGASRKQFICRDRSKPLRDSPTLLAHISTTHIDVIRLE